MTKKDKQNIAALGDSVAEMRENIAALEASVVEIREQMSEFEHELNRKAKRDEDTQLRKWMRANYFIDTSGRTVSYYDFVMAAKEGRDDPLKRFVDEVVPQLAWGFVPWRFLHDLYVAWLARNYPSEVPLLMRHFCKQVKVLLGGNTDWKWNDKSGVKPRNRMDVPEPLIGVYNLTQWMNPRYHGPDADMDKLCTPNEDLAYKTTRGMERRNWKHPDDNEEVNDD